MIKHKLQEVKILELLQYDKSWISLLTFDQTYVLSKNEKGLWTKPKLLVEEGEVGA